jgi:hypothetical protein
MYGKEKYSSEARSSEIRKAFIKAARKCGFTAQQSDSDMSQKDVDEMCRVSIYLEAELKAMRLRVGRLPQ